MCNQDFVRLSWIHIATKQHFEAIYIEAKCLFDILHKKLVARRYRVF